MNYLISNPCKFRIKNFIFRESVCKWWVAVQGLNHNEVRSISEKVQEQPEYNSEKEKRVEFSVPSWMVSLDLFKYMKMKVSMYFKTLFRIKNPTLQV
jgi:hypothetical protein